MKSPVRMPKEKGLHSMSETNAKQKKKKDDCEFLFLLFEASDRGSSLLRRIEFSFHIRGFGIACLSGRGTKEKGERLVVPPGRTLKRCSVCSGKSRRQRPKEKSGSRKESGGYYQGHPGRK